MQLVYGMKAASMRNRLKLAFWTSFITFLVYMCFSICNYLHFGQFLEEDVLATQNPTPKSYQVARIAVAGVYFLSYPLILIPTRGCLDWLLAIPFQHKKAWQKSETSRRIVETIFIFSLVLPVSIHFPDEVAEILGYGSSVCGSLLVYIFPSIFFLKMTCIPQISNAEIFAAYFNLVLGFVVMVGGTIGTLL